ncbi:MAG TPA: stage II sporulation protein M [Cerasibacillus sp.]|uniref:stage II sporulation protein M n=1 Tax=Cerasibacillus sp. TaxID=2498711 RepID=UPI002F3FBA57
MNVKQFVNQYRDGWHKLEQLMGVMRKEQASSDDINQFYRLYQKSAQHLSYAQTYFPNEEVTSYLNGLVAQSHNLFYKNTSSYKAPFRHFFTAVFVRLLWEQRTAIIIAFLLFMLGTIGSFLTVLVNTNVFASFLPEYIQQVDSNHFAELDKGITSGQSILSTSIMVNNIQVAVLAFAGGITFGILTTFVLIYNGVIIGTLLGHFYLSGQLYPALAYIVPHGVIELTAIFIAGGAGLLMGYKLFVPGRYSRLYHLKTQAKRSLQLLLGSVPMFVIAGIIEGYITPAAISYETKYLIALATVIGLMLYFWLGKMRSDYLLRRSMTPKV